MSQTPHELFMASCGVFGPWSVSVYRPNKLVEEHSFQSPYAVVGQGEDNCIHLMDRQASRRHAYLQVLPGGLFCVYLGGRRGLRWNGKHQFSGWLRPGQRVQMGSCEVELISTNQPSWLAPSLWSPADPLSDRLSDTLAVDPVLIEVVDAGDVLAHGKMNRAMALVGRSSHCLVRINNPSLSRFHCAVVRTPVGLWVVDLLSREGTFHNGTRIRCERIREGDEIRVGKFILRLRQEKNNALVPAARPVATTLQPSPAAVDSRNAKQTVLAGSPERVGPEWSLLVAMVNQFNQMQQQMFDQFQEHMVMTTQLFTSLHQDQKGIVRQELEQIRAIAGELRGLQEELNKHLAESPVPPGAPQTDGRNPVPLPGHAVNPSAQMTSTPESKTELPATASASAAPPSPQSNVDVHVWLTQRISALQEERQSRWNKLLGMVLGK